MLQYLIILLGQNATSFCHYQIEKDKKELISLENLRAGILFAMKHNLAVQFVYPPFELPEAYKSHIQSIEHTNIMPAECYNEEADIIVYDDIKSLSPEKEKIIVARTSKSDLFKSGNIITEILPEINRLNLIITDIEHFTPADSKQYQTLLDTWSIILKTQWQNNNLIQFNLITDRMLLNQMNNCNAGIDNITLAPDGKFYTCPAFYHNQSASIGTPEEGIEIKNKQLYKLAYAPICENCDAYQCKRCIWLNQKITLEVNTPSHEQCVVAHSERNAARNLSIKLQKTKLPITLENIPEINYSDPYEYSYYKQEIACQKNSFGIFLLFFIQCRTYKSKSFEQYVGRCC